MRGLIARISEKKEKKKKKSFIRTSRSTVFGQLIIVQCTRDRGYTLRESRKEAFPQLDPQNVRTTGTVTPEKRQTVLDMSPRKF